ncbi:cupin domain-containing protein [Actinoplanes sp. NPDC051513]|uniref:cupin domain-containing protein n=1 Tax=Actinoplanes sp. NPDC051513 TaxID=3363908 RepID=UPI00378BADF1
MSTNVGNRLATVVPSGTADVVELPSGSAFELLADASAARGAVSVNRLILTSGADGANPHYHELSDETFYVLDGVMEFLLGEELVTVGAGGLLVVPPKLPHAFGAAPGVAAEVLVVIAPGVERFGYFRQLERIASGREPSDSLLPQQERYDVHFTSDEIWRRTRDRSSRRIRREKDDDAGDRLAAAVRRSAAKAPLGIDDLDCCLPDPHRAAASRRRSDARRSAGLADAGPRHAHRADRRLRPPAPAAAAPYPFGSSLRAKRVRNLTVSVEISRR